MIRTYRSSIYLYLFNFLQTAAKSLETYPGFLPETYKDDFLEAVNNNSDTVFKAFTIDDYLWGYHDMTLNQSRLVERNVIDSATEGIFYGVRFHSFVCLYLLFMLSKK